jgi:hypothetical protein
VSVALTDVVAILAGLVGFVATFGVVGDQGTIDFTRDAETKEAAKRSQARWCMIAIIAFGVAFVTVWLTRFPPISFTILPR